MFILFLVGLWLRVCCGYYLWSACGWFVVIMFVVYYYTRLFWFCWCFVFTVDFQFVCGCFLFCVCGMIWLLCVAVAECVVSVEDMLLAGQYCWFTNLFWATTWVPLCWCSFVGLNSCCVCFCSFWLDSEVQLFSLEFVVYRWVCSCYFVVFGYVCFDVLYILCVCGLTWYWLFGDYAVGYFFW